MSTLQGSTPMPLATPDDNAAAPRWRLGLALERAGERLNPLLVKECRQSLKSRQFAISFTLVLILCWGWSIVGVAQLGPLAPYRFDGPEMFMGYFTVLAFPLLLIVPFSAFRSLIAEREDNTYELVAITALRPRQIVGGKLGSAVAQVSVYLSAVAPCLAFTYLLRGIDVVTIGWIIFYTCLASVAFSLMALLLATIAIEKHWQVVLSVVLVILLFLALRLAITLAEEILRSPRWFNEPGFWELNLAFLTGYVSSALLIYLAAGAQLTFAAENRSTPLRAAMLFQQILFAGWIGYLWTRAENPDVGFDAIAVSSLMYAGFSTLYWFVMGAFMIGESTELSQRVKRGLPKSFLGRVFLTWFNPGPGTGYLFAVCNSVAAGVLAFLGLSYWYAHRGARGGPTWEQYCTFIALAIGYLAIYLGLINLLLRGLRRVAQVTVATAVLIQGLVLLAGWGVPWLIRQSIDHYGSGYSLLHVTDPFWSTFVIIDPTGKIPLAKQLPWIIVPAALIVFVLNLWWMAPELRHVRIAPPSRVDEEDAALAAPLHPSQPQPSSPWD